MIVIMHDIMCMGFREDVNMFVPKRSIVEKYMEGFVIPDFINDGANDVEEYAVAVASMLKYGKTDFYGKLVFSVESYSSNGYDVRVFSHLIYQDSFMVSPSNWEDVVFGYAGMPSLFQSIALLKTDVLGGKWIGIGYMDFDYVRRRVTSLAGVLSNAKTFYEGTNIINFDVLKTAGLVLRSMHNASALHKHNLPVNACINDEQVKLYTSQSSGDVDFRGLTPEAMESVVKVVLAWHEAGLSQEEMLNMVVSNSEALTPNVFWELMCCGVTEDYSNYVGLPADYVKEMFL